MSGFQVRSSSPCTRQWEAVRLIHFLFRLAFSFDPLRHNTGENSYKYMEKLLLVEWGKALHIVCLKWCTFPAPVIAELEEKRARFACGSAWEALISVLQQSKLPSTRGDQQARLWCTPYLCQGSQELKEQIHPNQWLLFMIFRYGWLS